MRTGWRETRKASISIAERDETAAVLDIVHTKKNTFGTCSGERDARSARRSARPCASTLSAFATAITPTGRYSSAKARPTSVWGATSP